MAARDYYGDTIDAQVLGSSFTVEGKIGEGSYGVVFLAKTNATHAPVAIKKLRLDGFSEGVPATAIREITLLQELQHPNIVRLLQVLCKRHRLYLVFELAQEDLRKYILRRVHEVKATGRDMTKTVILTTNEMKSFVKQMLDALWYCHQHRVIHRDLKPQNVLIGQDMRQVMLADFGLARAFDMPVCTYTHEVVTMWYRAPEILLGEPHYTPAVDIWSVGCILAEMATGKPLFRGDSEVDQLYKIFSIVGTPTEATWPGVTALKDFNKNFPKWKAQTMAELFPQLQAVDPQACSLLQGMLEPNPKNRMSATQALQHPWFGDYRDM